MEWEESKTMTEGRPGPEQIAGTTDGGETVLLKLEFGKTWHPPYCSEDHHVPGGPLGSLPSVTRLSGWRA
jgi:hypothetical protein